MVVVTSLPYNHMTQLRMVYEYPRYGGSTLIYANAYAVINILFVLFDKYQY